MFDIVIIGAGAAGAAAALGATGHKVLMLDCGLEPHDEIATPRAPRLIALRDRAQDLFPLLVGKKYEGTALIGGRSTLSPKLKSPRMSFVTDRWRELSPASGAGFDPQMSFALGGLANAWGAGVYRFNAGDLAGFPLAPADLAPAYDELTRHLGISGATDDLTPDFGDTRDLLPPMRLNRGPALVYRGYRKHRNWFHQRGLRIGQPRLAVLTLPHDGRPAYDYRNLEFFTPNEASIYSPGLTVRRLVAAGALQYRGGVLATRFEETADGVVVHARDLASDSQVTFAARRLVLAAGCLNSAKLALASAGAIGRKLPLLDNLVSYLPLFHPALVGLRTERRCFGMGGLNLIYKGPLSPEPIQATMYDLSGPLRSDILMDFPLAPRDALAGSRFLTQAMCLVQFFYPDDPHPENAVALANNGELRLTYAPRTLGVIERHALWTFLRLGWLGLPLLCRFPPAGSSYHYAGSLPMRARPGPFETDPSGRLSGTRGVFVADAAAFSRLPSKNLTFTAMANAFRISRAAVQSPA